MSISDEWVIKHDLLIKWKVFAHNTGEPQKNYDKETSLKRPEKCPQKSKSTKTERPRPRARK